jgi:hypothetical protein
LSWSRRTTSRRFHGLGYDAIGNAYRAANGFMILQRINTASAVTAP